MLKITILKILGALSYGVMLLFNILANTLPLGGRSTGEISQTYNTLFTPSGLTFSIWGLIYVSLLFLLVYFLRKPSKAYNNQETMLIICFIVTSLLNAAWLFAWHYDWISLSTVIMIVLLITLVIAYRNVDKKAIIASLSISLYLGWISIALIANITITFVYYGVNPFTTLAVIVTNLLLIIGAVIVGYMVKMFKDSIYPLVFSWAYLGIFIRHLMGENLNDTYYSITILSGSLTFIFLLVGMHYFNINKGYLRDNV